MHRLQLHRVADNKCAGVAQGANEAVINHDGGRAAEALRHVEDLRPHDGGVVEGGGGGRCLRVPLLFHHLFRVQIVRHTVFYYYGVCVVVTL